MSASVWEQAKQMLPGFVAGGVFDGEGLILDGLSESPSFHLDHAAASFVTMIKEANQIGRLINLGEGEQVQIEYGDIVILMRSVFGSERDLSVGLAVRRDTPLGRVRMAMDFLMSRLH